MKHFAAIVLWLISCSASAYETAQFRITLTIERVSMLLPTCVSGPTLFGCVAVGEQFGGEIAFSDAALGSDGVQNTLTDFAFNLSLGDVRYSTGADNVHLAGFRNEFGHAPTLGVSTFGGELRHLVGGVYGVADQPYVDFFGDSAGTGGQFVAFDGISSIRGSFDVHRVPSPATHLLLAAGLGMLMVFRRRR